MNDQNILKIKNILISIDIPVFFENQNALQAYCQQNISKINKLRTDIKFLLDKDDNAELQDFFKKISTKVLVNQSKELWDVIKLINNQ